MYWFKVVRNNFYWKTMIMNAINLGRHKFLRQKEHILLLEKISQNYINGCLQVLSISQSWAFYLEKGKLIYAYQSHSMWDIFYEKLQQLIPHNNINNQLLGQFKAIFDSQTDEGTVDRPDYLAICWLVEQEYLNPLQAGKLIEEVAVGVLDSFLKQTDGIYEFVSESLPDYLPKFCYLDISLLGRRCQLRSMNLTNITNGMQPFNRYKVGLPELVQQELVNLERQLIPDKTNNAIVITKGVENGTIENNKSDPLVVEKSYGERDGFNSRTTEQKIYKVLCIDDSPIILKAISGFLDKQLFTVIGVDDPLKALMQILRIKPDIILLDISMPNLDGYELCSLLRKHPHFRKTPVVMVTGRTGLLDKARAKMVKSSGYLSKPFSKADLLKVVFSQISYMS